MQTILFNLLFCLIAVQSIGQSQSKTSTYVYGQYSKTLYDYTKGNNLSSYGLGLQTFFNNTSVFRPSVELTGDFIYVDDKVFRTYADGSAVKSVTGMLTLFAGAAFHPAKKVYLSVLAGPGYVNGRVLPGIKPSIGYYFSNNQRATVKISYINIFNRDKATGADFGALSFALGLKIF